MKASGGWQSIKGAIQRRRRLARGTLLWIEAAAAIATLAVLAIGIVNHFMSDSNTFPGEGKRVVAFRQVTNRICTEHRRNIHRTMVEARSRLERLGYVARALGWDLNDLESITPPPTRFKSFLAEVAVRRDMRSEILALQQAIELGDEGAKATAIAALEDLEREARELSQESGVIRCTKVLPPLRGLVQG